MWPKARQMWHGAVPLCVYAPSGPAGGQKSRGPRTPAQPHHPGRPPRSPPLSLRCGRERWSLSFFDERSIRAARREGSAAAGSGGGVVLGCVAHVISDRQPALRRPTRKVVRHLTTSDSVTDQDRNWSDLCVFTSFPTKINLKVFKNNLRFFIKAAAGVSPPA